MSHLTSVHPTGVKPPATRGRWIALVLLCAAQFMLILDVTVINVALPQLGRELNLDGGSASWAITAYVIPFGGLLLFGGRLSDLLGSQRIFLAGLALFTVASLFAGLADGAPWLFAARSAQGIGAALLSPAALATVTGRFSGADRHRALAIWGAVGAVGAAIGVLIGGILTEGAGWRWIFFINIPVGVLVAVLLPLVVPAVSAVRSGRRMDVPGAILVTLGAGSLIYGITSIGGTSLPVVWISLIGAAGVLFALFVMRERTARDPLLDLRIVARRPVQAGIVIMLGASALLVGSFFLLSFVLQNHHRLSALGARLAFFPVALATLVGAHLAGSLVSRLGGRLVAATAFAIAAIGAGVAAIEVETIPLLVAGVSVTALGLGSAFVAATTTAMSHVQPQELGVASGIINTFHELGAALGVATLSVIAAGSLAQPESTTGFVSAYATAAVVALGVAIIAALLVPAGRPAADAPRFAH
ncbi:MFS transporter [Lacisediminihabitans profunda]|uniref:MFS transporter n=1 Tax=Lacisediminihabitans profunda TaxID=2594790 RepID=A0A5C8UQ55_9MICO|nr:MFS transporter [Lacisediminihabitans profunda]TXN30623.1 MFS transporter [Lacisediminihabitans profunda]